MVGPVTFIFAPPDGLAIDCEYVTRTTLRPEPIHEDIRQFGRIKALKETPECVCIRYPVRKFKVEVVFEKLLRNCSRSLPNPSMSLKSSPSQMTVHKPMIIMSSSLWRMFP